VEVGRTRIAPPILIARHTPVSRMIIKRPTPIVLVQPRSLRLNILIVLCFAHKDSRPIVKEFVCVVTLPKDFREVSVFLVPKGA
jgi:hypothetical protein